MSETVTSVKKLRRLRTNTRRNKPPFLTRKEIRQLAQKLETTQFIVESVLQVAGHVLRERYRRRGWKPVERTKGAPSPPNTARHDVRTALDGLELAQ